MTSSTTLQRALFSSLLCVGLVPARGLAADLSGACSASQSGELEGLTSSLDQAISTSTSPAPGFSRYRFRVPAAEMGSIFIRQRAEVVGTLDMEDTANVNNERMIQNVQFEIKLAPDARFELGAYTVTPMRAGETSELDYFSGWKEPSRGYSTKTRDGFDVSTDAKVQLGGAARGTVLEDGAGTRADGSAYTTSQNLHIDMYCGHDLTGCKLGILTPGIYFGGSYSATRPNVRLVSEETFPLEKL